MNYSQVIVAIALAGFIAASSAQSVTYFTGNTSNAPTYNRLCVGTSSCGAVNPTFGFSAAMSGVGTAVHYAVTEFTVAQQGVYSFLSATTTWDNYTFLYHDSFTPSNPFLNLVTGNDDYNGINIGGTSSIMNLNNKSGFTTTLDAATHYMFINTAYKNIDFGEFTASISGPAGVTILSTLPDTLADPVPEPGSASMLALGLAGLALLGRRRGRSVGARAAAGNPVGEPARA